MRFLPPAKGRRSPAHEFYAAVQRLARIIGNDEVTLGILKAIAGHGCLAVKVQETGNAK